MQLTRKAACRQKRPGGYYDSGMIEEVCPVPADEADAALTRAAARVLDDLADRLRAGMLTS